MKQCKHTRANSWWLRDARGIEIGRVCDKCEAKVRARYRPEIFTDAGYDLYDETLEESY